MDTQTGKLGMERLGFPKEKNQHPRSSKCLLYRVDKERDIIVDKHGGGAYSIQQEQGVRFSQSCQKQSLQSRNIHTGITKDILYIHFQCPHLDQKKTLSFPSELHLRGKDLSFFRVSEALRSLTCPCPCQCTCLLTTLFTQDPPLPSGFLIAFKPSVCIIHILFLHATADRHLDYCYLLLLKLHFKIYFIQ